MSLNYKTLTTTNKKPESDMCGFALDFPFGTEVKICKLTRLACPPKIFNNPTVHNTCSDKQRYTNEGE